MTIVLDPPWLHAHPLPVIAGGDKNARGRVLVVGGAEFVPGALRLTGEAALRAGAGKLQLATVRAAAMALAVLVPEAAMIALPADADGEIAVGAVPLLTDQLARCDAVIAGPGMSAGAHTARLVDALVDTLGPGQTIVLDAAALTCCAGLGPRLRALEAHVLMTPHHGELAHLTGLDIAEIAADPLAQASRVARQFNAVVALKGERTIIAAPDGSTARFEGGSIGLATSGSGDVLAGIIGGLAARGADPMTAAGWGVFIHGAAGAQAEREIAATGFLARDLLPAIPRLIASHSA